MNVQGKVAIITGAGSGIGQATAAELAERGIKALGLVDRSENVLRIARSINDMAGGAPLAEGYVGDVTDPAFRKKVFDHVQQKYGVAQICIPSAAITRDALSVKFDKAQGLARVYSVEDFKDLLEVNLLSPVYWALEMIARMAEDRHKRGLGRWSPSEGVQGAVIFIGSVSTQGTPGQIAYAAAKSGLEGAAATLAKEATYHGVRAAVIHPGYTNTPMVRALGEEYIAKNILPHTRLGRLIEPEEIADAIYFLLSNSAVSGELWADAGWHPTA